MCKLQAHRWGRQHRARQEPKPAQPPLACDVQHAEVTVIAWMRDTREFQATASIQVINLATGPAQGVCDTSIGRDPNTPFCQQSANGLRPALGGRQHDAAGIRVMAECRPPLTQQQRCVQSRKLKKFRTARTKQQQHKQHLEMKQLRKQLLQKELLRQCGQSFQIQL